MLAIGLVCGFTACNEDTEDIVDDFCGNTLPPISLKIYLGDENGVNLLSSVDGNWLYAPFSITMGDYTTSIHWDKFIPEQGGAYEITTIEQTVKRNGPELIRIPDSYYIAYRGSLGRNRGGIVFHFEELRRDYIITPEIKYNEKTNKEDFRILVDGEVAATNSEEILLVVPRRGSVPESDIQ